MTKHRGKGHCLCSELVAAKWQDVFQYAREETVNLEEIWESGAVLNFDCPVRIESSIAVICKGIELRGRVTDCSADFAGYMVEIRFDEGCHWTAELYEPEHFLDPQSLVKQDELSQKNDRLLEDILRHLPELVA